MTTFDAEFRLTVYDDEDMTTALTPPSAAPHSDEFKVATTTGLSGYQPYLFYPRGRESSIEPKDARADTAKQEVELLDKRTSSGNLERWVTAFVSDLGGHMAQMEISTDGGSSWSNYFTGRLQEPGLRSRARFRFVIEGMNTEFDTDVFVGMPHSSIDYAFMAPAWPVGLTEEWAGADTKPRIPTTARITGDIYGDRLEVDDAALTGEMADRNVVTRALKDQMLSVLQRLNLLEASDPAPGLRVLADNTTTGNSGQFYVTRGFSSGGLFASSSGHIGTERTEDGHHRVTQIGIKELPASDPNHLSLPSDGDSVEIALAVDRPPDEQTPLLVDDVHPVKLLRDIVDGRFSHLDDDGSVRWSVPRDTTSQGTLDGHEGFANLIADSSFGGVRFIVEGSMTAKEAWEELVGHAARIGRRWKGNGEVVPVDLRVPDDPSGLDTIGNSDLDVSGNAPQWDHSRRDAVTLVEVTQYVDEVKGLGRLKQESAEYPELRPVQIESSESPVRVLDVGDPSLGVKPHEIDAKGIRSRVGEGTKEDQDAAERQLKRIKALAQEYRIPYGDGPEYIELPLRRTSTAEGLTVGQPLIVDVDELPDPATSKRGGARVVRATGIRRDRANVILTALDLYESATASTPSVGDPSPVSGGDGRFLVEFDVTLNADGDPARVEIAVTSTSTASRPAEAAAAWQFVERVSGSANSTHTVQVEVPAGKRVWPRVRSVPDDKAPSDWAHPSGDNTDSDDLASVSNLSHSNVDGSSALATWDVGDSDLDVVVELENTTDSEVVKTVALPPDTTQHEWRGLTSGDGYKTTVWHRGPSDEAGPKTSDTFTAGASNQQAPKLAGFGILYGRNFQVGTEDPGDSETGFVVFIMPRDSSLPVTLEVAPDDGTGSPDTGSSEEVTVAPGAREYTVHRPMDGDSRFVRAKHTEGGSDDGEWTAWHEAVPRKLPYLMPDPPEDPFVTADVRVDSDGSVSFELDGSLAVGSYVYVLQTGSSGGYTDPSGGTVLAADSEGDASVSGALQIDPGEVAFLSVDVHMSDDGSGTPIASARASSRFGEADVATITFSEDRAAGTATAKADITGAGTYTVRVFRIDPDGTETEVATTTGVSDGDAADPVSHTENLREDENLPLRVEVENDSTGKTLQAETATLDRDEIADTTLTVHIRDDGTPVAQGRADLDGEGGEIRLRTATGSNPTASDPDDSASDDVVNLNAGNRRWSKVFTSVTVAKGDEVSVKARAKTSGGDLAPSKRIQEDGATRPGDQTSFDARPTAELREDSRDPSNIKYDLKVTSGSDVSNPNLRYRYLVTEPGQTADFSGQSWNGVSDANDGAWLDQAISATRSGSAPKQLHVQAQDQAPASSPTVTTSYPVFPNLDGLDDSDSGKVDPGSAPGGGYAPPDGGTPPVLSKYLDSNHEARQNLLEQGAGPEKSGGNLTSQEHIIQPISVAELEVGDVVSASADVKSDSGSDTVRIQLRFRDASDTIIQKNNSEEVTTSTYTRVDVEDVTIPANTESIELLRQNLDTTENSQSRRRMLNKGPIAESFEHPPLRRERETAEDLLRAADSNSLETVTQMLGSGGSAQKEFSVGDFLTARHVETGTAQDGDSISFSQQYDTAPKLMFIPQVGRAFQTSNSDSDQSIDLRGKNLDVSGFDLVARVVTSTQTTAIDDGFSDTRNSSSPENGTVQLDTDGDTAFSNLEDEDSDGTTTTYVVAYDVDGPGGVQDPPTSLTVHVDVSDAASGGSWTEVTSKSYTSSTDILNDETLSFDANLLENYDIRLRITGTNVNGNWIVTAHGEDSTPPGVEYDRVDGRSDATMTPNSGDRIFWLAMESSA